MEISVNGLINGLMVYWEKVPNATRYFVYLYVVDFTKEQGKDKYGHNIQIYKENKCIEIDCEEIPRNKSFFSFTNLAYLSKVVYSWQQPARVEVAKNYYVEVRAEDREGNIIDTSGKVCGLIQYYLRNGEHWGYAPEQNWEEGK